MRSINPKCTNNESFKYSILISLHYYELNNHPEKINKLKPYINKYKFTSNNYIDFENNNPYISLTVYDEYGGILHKSINKKNINVQIVKINNYRYHTLKPNKDKYTQLKNLLKQFTHKEITRFILNKITQ